MLPRGAVVFTVEQTFWTQEWTLIVPEVIWSSSNKGIDLRDLEHAFRLLGMAEQDLSILESLPESDKNRM